MKTINNTSFKFRGACDWNGLPLYLRNMNKIGAFKKGVKVECAQIPGLSFKCAFIVLKLIFLHFR
jgi:hypothetical protein